MNIGVMGQLCNVGRLQLVLKCMQLCLTHLYYVKCVKTWCLFLQVLYLDIL